MATAASVKAKIQGLIDTANATTGGSDTNLTSAVNALVDGYGQGGGGGGSIVPVAKKDVNFYDYEGTRLYSYTFAEAQALTALPDLPEHEGLTAQEWNHTLEEIKSNNRPVDVGATYITDDGKTRYYITVNNEAETTITLRYNQSVAGGTTIDWGDGTTQTVSTANAITISHTYASVGDYVIKLSVDDGCVVNLYGGSPYQGLMDGKHQLKRLEIGNGVSKCSTYQAYSLSEIVIPNSVTTIYNNAFKACYSIKAIVLPKNITINTEDKIFWHCYSLKKIVFPDKFLGTLYYGSFEHCSSLQEIVLPNNSTYYSNMSALCKYCYALESAVLPNITKMNGNAFEECHNLQKVYIPDGLTSIGYREFYYCNSLSHIVIPNSVTEIGQQAFYFTGLGIVDFSAFDHIPTLGSQVFSTSSSLKIHVPSALYDEWKAASGWSEYANYIVAV